MTVDAPAESAGPVAGEVENAAERADALSAGPPHRRPWTGWVLIAAGCLVAVGALYGFAVHTEIGQRLDNAAILRHHLDRTPEADVSVSNRILILATVSLLPAVVWFGRKDRSALVISGCGVMATVLMAEILRETLPRPDLGIFDPSYGPSYPSGHGAAAMALALAFAVAVRDRPVLRSVAFVVPSFVAAAAVATPIHRPSDLAAGFAIAFAGMSAAHGSRRNATGARAPASNAIRPRASAGTAAAPRTAAPAGTTAQPRNLLLGTVAGVIGLTGGLLVVEAIALRRAHLTLADLGPAFPLSVLALVALAAIAVAAFGQWLRRAEL